MTKGVANCEIRFNISTDNVEGLANINEIRFNISTNNVEELIMILCLFSLLQSDGCNLMVHTE